MWRWMTFRKGALTTYYPEETRADYAAGNRGKHVLTQRPDGRPQCIACNLCATVCPAKVIEIEAGFDPDDPAHPKYPVRFEIDYSRCVFCGLCVEACPEDAIRMVKEVPNLPTYDRGSAVAVAPRAAHLESAAATSPSRIRAKGDRAAAGRGRHDRDRAALALRRHGARRRGADARAAPSDARRARAHRDDALAGRRLRAARRARDRGLPGADLRRRRDGVHGLRDHAARRARSLVHAPLLAAAGARESPLRVLFLAILAHALWHALPEPPDAERRRRACASASSLSRSNS